MSVLGSVTSHNLLTHAFCKSFARTLDTQHRLVEQAGALNYIYIQLSQRVHSLSTTN